MHESGPHVDPLVDLIFAKCTLVYGRDFLARWEGLDIVEVKLDWQRELQGWLQNPPAIRHALEHLPPGRAPDVLQFRDLCRRRPTADTPALPPPAVRADPQRVRAEVARLKALRSTAGPRAWARRLQERDRHGETMTPTQRAMYRAALGIQVEAAEEVA